MDQIDLKQLDQLAAVLEYLREHQPLPAGVAVEISYHISQARERVALATAKKGKKREMMQ